MGTMRNERIAELERQIDEKDAKITELKDRLTKWQQGINRVGTEYDLNQKDAEIERLRRLLASESLKPQGTQLEKPDTRATQAAEADQP